MWMFHDANLMWCAVFVAALFGLAFGGASCVGLGGRTGVVGALGVVGVWVRVFVRLRLRLWLLPFDRVGVRLLLCPCRLSGLCDGLGWV